MIAEFLDAAILVWLIFTWFFEGHHRRCKVEVICKACGAASEHNCEAGR